MAPGGDLRHSENQIHMTQYKSNPGLHSCLLTYLLDLKALWPVEALTLTQKGKLNHPNQTMPGAVVGPSTKYVMTMIIEILKDFTRTR